MKKFLSLLLVTTLLVTAILPIAMADETTTHTITITGSTSGHTYEAYQIFKGNADNEDELGNIEWGDGVNGEELLKKLKESELQVTKKDGGTKDSLKNIFGSANKADDVAKILDSYADDSEMAKAFAEVVSTALKSDNGSKKTSTYSSGSHTISNVTPGYYFIQDSVTVPKGEAKTRYLLKVIGKDETIKVKGDAPTLEKTVLKDNDIFTDVADYEIGDIIPFHLEGTLPTNYDDYKTYKYKFTDTLSSGLTFVDGGNHAVKVEYVSKDNQKTDITSSFKVEKIGPEPIQQITITCDDLKSVTQVQAGGTILVTYYAQLNEDAAIGNATSGAEGNTNTASLEFSNNPNASGSGETTTTEDTPNTDIAVFTFQLDITKQDSRTNSPLTGVGFKIYKMSGGAKKWAQFNEDGVLTGWTDNEEDGTERKTDAQGKLSFVGLAADTYYLKETTVLDGYNSIEDAKLEIEVVYDEEEKKVSKLSLKVNDQESQEGNILTGIVSTTVSNRKGSRLPSTGGMGTVMIYTLGVVLVSCSLLLLYSKKQKEKK